MSETAGTALATLRRANGLPASPETAASWVTRVGPLTLRFPNVAWRRQAITRHDLHHLVTGYPFTLAGECQMAAWEWASGGFPHVRAALFCLPLVLLGLAWVPARTCRALRQGRRSRNLYGDAPLDRLLARPVSELRAQYTSRR